MATRAKEIALWPGILPRVGGIFVDTTGRLISPFVPCSEGLIRHTYWIRPFGSEFVVNDLVIWTSWPSARHNGRLNAMPGPFVLRNNGGAVGNPQPAIRGGKQIGETLAVQQNVNI